MPIKHSLWKVGNPPTQLDEGQLPSEKMLHDMIKSAPELLSPDWMLIGSEVQTIGGRLDLLAIAPDGSLVLIELKRDRTPRDVVAQALDYASWVERLSPDRIAAIYHLYSKGEELSWLCRPVRSTPDRRRTERQPRGRHRRLGVGRCD